MPRHAGDHRTLYQDLARNADRHAAEASGAWGLVPFLLALVLLALASVGTISP